MHANRPAEISGTMTSRKMGWELGEEKTIVR